MTKLVLDPMCVLSAWEQMGGSAFSSDDAHWDDPDAFTLDLSSWEARLKPLSSTSEVDTNIFATLFNPTEFSFPFLSSCCMHPPGSSFLPEGAQVVPLCPSVSAGSMDQFPTSDGGYGSADCASLSDIDMTQGSHLDEEVHMSVHFSDSEPAPSASPTCSEAGIVPEFDATGSPHAMQGHHLSPFTDCSGSCPSLQTPIRCAQYAVEAQEATTPNMPLLPVLPAQGSVSAHALPSSMFVPVSQPHTAPSAAVANCEGLIAQEESVNQSTAEGQQHQVIVSPPAASLMVQQQTSVGSGASVVSGRQAITQQGQPALNRPHGSSAATVGHSQLQTQQQPGAPTHVRTRAECLERYRQKKARRLYTKKIRYQLRKINADKRPRIKGRFVKKEELAEFLAAQRCATGGAAAQVEAEDPYFGFGSMDSDDD